jgi:serine/threonine protein kinase
MPVVTLGGQPPLPDFGAALGVELGAVIADKYRIDRVIGTGGMGVVVAASQLALDRTVAIKLIRPEFAEEPLAVQRLLREAKAAASIQSEHVARVLDVGTLENGVPFIVMEYLEGSDLQTLLERDGPLPVADAVDILLEACEAFAEAHRNGIVHRDIKPENLFLARLPGGRLSVKVVDFGISKLIGLGAIEPLTQPSSVVGSLYHMAPEQMLGAAVDARTDLWALGVMLFEMLTGRKPFRDDAWPAVCAEVLNGDAPVLAAPVAGLGDELQAIIQKCLHRRPEDRFGNVAELAVSLSRFGSSSSQISLERIVSLATSTGSLSAQELPALHDSTSASDAGLDSNGVPEKTRPVPPREPSTARRSPSGAPARATPSTPLPVSSSRAALAGAATRRRVAAIGAAALLVIVPAAVWLWPSTEPAEGEPSTPLVRVVAGGPVDSAPASPSAGHRPPEAGAPEKPENRERLPTSGSDGPSRGSGGAPAGPAVAPLPVIPEPEATRAAPPATPPKPAPVETRGGTPPPERDKHTPVAHPAGASPPRVTGPESSEPPSPSEAPAPAEAAGEPRRTTPARPKPGSPWELHDIGFDDEAKR